MINKSIRNGFNSGIVFGIIILFLALIGFTVTAATLVAKLFNHAPAVSQMPGVGFLVIFLALLGLWNGISAAGKDARAGKFLNVVIDALAAGLTTGLINGLLSLLYGYFLANNIDPRESLAMVTPESMKLFLFNQSPAVAFLEHLAIMLGSALAGGLIDYGWQKVSAGARIAAMVRKLTGRVGGNTTMSRLRSTPYAIVLLYVVVAVALFFLPRTWGSYWNYIIGTVGIYVILGLGLNIIVGYAGQLILGYVVFFAIGAYSMALLTAPQPHHLMMNFWVALVIGILLAGLAGVLLGLPILRLRGDYLAIVTLGLGEIIRILLRSDILTPFTAGPKGVPGIGGPTLFGKTFSSDVDFMYLIILAVLFILFITNRLQNSRTGRSWIAIREDEVAARATGINTFQSKLLALAIGAAFAGLGGALFASRNQFTGPEDQSFMVSINVLSLVIVGGMGNIPGVILGSFVLKGLPEMLRELDIYRLLFFGALLVVMMVLRPEGLWPAGHPQLEKQLESQQNAKKPTEPPVETVEVEEVHHASKP
jgi:branched-chain amino acid transport system permease protein